MKKLLIAAAAMSVVAGAQAQSSVTIYGQADVSYGQNKIDKTGTAPYTNVKTTGLADNALTTSLIGFRGTEDLGGGTKANFTLESALGLTGGQPFSKTNTAASTTLASASAVNASTTDTDSAIFGQATRQALIGLEGSAGRLDVGYKKMAELDAFESIAQGTGNSYGGKPWKQGGNVDRANGFYYKSPVMSGMQATVQYSQGKAQYEDSTTNNNFKYDINVVGLTLNYNQGPVSAVLHHTSGSVDVGTLQTSANISGQSWTGSGVTNGAQAAGDNDYKSTVVGGAYNFGVAKVNAIYTERKVGTAASNADVKAWDFGVSVPFGKTTLVAAYETADRDNQAGVKQDTMDAYQLIAKYDFSKRTGAYALYGKETLKPADGSAKTDYSTVRLGMVHKF